MYVVRILSRCDNVTALGTNAQGQFAFVNANYPFNPNSYWYLDQAFAIDGTPLGVSLRHVNTGSCLVAQPGAGPGNTLSFHPVDSFDGWSTWTLGNVGGEAFALRPFNNGDLNLNRLGGCGGWVAGLWGWGGGQPNEVWRVIPVSGVPVPPRRRYRIDSGCADFKGNHFSLSLGADGPVTVGGSVADSIWNVELFWKPDGSLQPGVGILNEANGQSLNYVRGNTRVGLTSASSFNNYNLWTFGGGGPYVAVRPVVESSQNLNVEGGCAGTIQPVCTWQWSGGQANEIWKFIRLP